MSGSADYSGGGGWDQTNWDWQQQSQQPQWHQPEMDSSGFFRSEDMVLDAEQLTFQQDNFGQPPPQNYDDRYAPKMSFFYDQPQGYFQPGPDPMKPPPTTTSFEDEPPLLEELGIFPDQIAKRVLVVLDPFHSAVPLGEYDLGGPLVFCLILGFTMLLSGGKVHFGYVYGIGTTSCLLMYSLLHLMTNANSVSLVSVASVLGYCLLPIVILSAVGILLPLNNKFGYIFAGIGICWASLAASRIFVTMTSDMSQRPLIIYPCALLYGVFTLLVIF